MISSDWGSQIFLKKFCGENLSQIGQNQAWKYVSYHFLKLGWLVSLEIAFSDSLQPCVTSSRGKIHEKKFGAQVWVKGAKFEHETFWPKFGPKSSFLF